MRSRSAIWNRSCARVSMAIRAGRRLQRRNYAGLLPHLQFGGGFVVGFSKRMLGVQADGLLQDLNCPGYWPNSIRAIPH